MTLLAILLVGAVTGFLGGLFGKGGSALATPVLAAFGIPPIIAVASPLPATIPGTLLAARQYGRRGLIDRGVTRTCILVGLPATVVGALFTRWVPGASLVTATDVIVGGLGLSVLIGATRRARRSDAEVVDADGVSPVGLVDPSGAEGAPALDGDDLRAADPTTGISGGRRVPPGGPGHRAELPAAVAIAPQGNDHLDRGADTDQPASVAVATTLDEAVALGRSSASSHAPPTVDGPGRGATIAVAAGVGLLAGLLANSGGFLLAPLFLVVLRLPVRSAMGTSLAVAAALAVPGTLTHAALGHIDLTFVLVFGAASVPLSVLGARTGLRVDPERLEVVFGAALVILSSVLLVWG